MKRFHEVIKDSRSGKDVITETTVPVDGTVEIPARGVYVLELL